MDVVNIRFILDGILNLSILMKTLKLYFKTIKSVFRCPFNDHSHVLIGSSYSITMTCLHWFKGILVMGILHL